MPRYADLATAAAHILETGYVGSFVVTAWSFDDRAVAEYEFYMTEPGIANVRYSLKTVDLRKV